MPTVHSFADILNQLPAMHGPGVTSWAGRGVVKLSDTFKIKSQPVATAEFYMWEAGIGGAPEEATKRIDLLLKDYQEGAKRLTELGFNGSVLDLEPPKAEERAIPQGDEAKIEAIIKNKALNKSGSLFKIGEQIANSQNVLEAARRVREKAEKSKVEKEYVMQEKKDNANMHAILHYAKWVRDGKQSTPDGQPKLCKEGALAIVFVLLPRCSPNEKKSDYKTMKKCNQWLGSLASRGTSWDKEMQKFEKEDQREFAACQGHLF
jgi:hypothetical protein